MVYYRVKPRVQMFYFLNISRILGGHYYRLLIVYGEIIVGPRFLADRGPTMISPYTISNRFIAYFDIVIT